MTSALESCDMAAAAYHLALPPVVNEIRSGNDYVQIRADADAVYVCPAGTDDWRDWLSNGKYDMVDTDYGHVHQGFNEAWLAMESSVLHVIEKYPGRRIDIQGHSRGGALSYRASVAIWHHLHRYVDCLTLWATPRAGDWKFCVSVTNACRQIIRYETRMAAVPFLRDPVPHLPPRDMGYRHAGRPTYLTAFAHTLDQHDLSTYRKAIAKRLKRHATDRHGTRNRKR